MKILVVVWNFYPNTAYTNHTKSTVRGFRELRPKYHANCYDVNGVLMLFSETIFYPNSGFGEFEPKKWDLEIREMLSLPIIKQMRVNCDSQFIREEVRLCA